MQYETLLLSLEDEGHVAILTLNRSEKLNAVDDRMYRELATAIDEVAGEEKIRVLVITGAGRGFCSGADVTKGSGTTGIQMVRKDTTVTELKRWISEVAQPAVRKLRYLEKPTIAMVNGVAVGVGLDLALSCDVRIGSDDARFGAGFTARGLPSGTGGAWLMPRIIGMSRTAQFYLSGEFVEAEDAEKMGLLNLVVAKASLKTETMSLAHKMSKLPPVAARSIKRLLRQASAVDFDMALDLSAEAEATAAVARGHE